MINRLGKITAFIFFSTKDHILLLQKCVLKYIRHCSMKLTSYVQYLHSKSSGSYTETAHTTIDHTANIQNSFQCVCSDRREFH